MPTKNVEYRSRSTSLWKRTVVRAADLGTKRTEMIFNVNGQIFSGEHVPKELRVPIYSNTYKSKNERTNSKESLSEATANELRKPESAMSDVNKVSYRNVLAK